MLTKYNSDNIKEFDYLKDSDIDIKYRVNDQDNSFINDENLLLELNLTKIQQNIVKYLFKEYYDLKINVIHFTYQMKKYFGKVINLKNFN